MSSSRHTICWMYCCRLSVSTLINYLKSGFDVIHLSTQFSFFHLRNNQIHIIKIFFISYFYEFRMHMMCALCIRHRIWHLSHVMDLINSKWSLNYYYGYTWKWMVFLVGERRQNNIKQQSYDSSDTQNWYDKC